MGEVTAIEVFDEREGARGERTRREGDSNDQRPGSGLAGHIVGGRSHEMQISLLPICVCGSQKKKLSGGKPRCPTYIGSESSHLHV